MKLLMKFAVALFALTVSLNALAKETRLSVYSDTTLDGQKVAAGNYKLDYQIEGSKAEVRLLKGNKTVATATGQVVENEGPATQTGIVRSQNPDGSSSIVEIQVEKQKSVIRFAPETAQRGQ